MAKAEMVLVIDTSKAIAQLEKFRADYEKWRQMVIKDLLEVG